MEGTVQYEGSGDVFFAFYKGSDQQLDEMPKKDIGGTLQWHTSDSGVNAGYGVNEWSESWIMTTLNGAYWNKTTGECYMYRVGKTTCDFSSIGLTPKAKDKIAKVRWNTGTIPSTSDSSNVQIKMTANYMYMGG